MKDRKHHVDIIFIIVLIGVFAISSVMLAIMGVTAYKDNAAEGSDQQLDTAALYFAQKVRQCDGSTDIRIDAVDSDTPALVIKTDAGNEPLETWIFVSDGNLKELTSIRGTEPAADFGQQIMTLKDATFSILGEGLLKVSLTSDDGLTSTVNLHISDREVRDE